MRRNSTSRKSDREVDVPRRTPRHLLTAVLTVALILPVPLTGENPAVAASRQPKVFLGYWAQWGNDQSPAASLNANLSQIDFFSPYWHTLRSDGTLSSRESGHASLTALVHARGGKVLPLINKTSDDTPLVDAGVRRRAVGNIYQLLVDGGYDGVNIDFEGMGAWTRSGVTAFMTELADTLRPAGLLVTMAVPARWSSDDSANDFAACFDYPTLGRVVDYLVIMTYDQHGGWSGPGPVAGADWVEKVAEYAASVVPPEKILLGLAGYGYDWSSNGTATVEAADAQALASRYGVEIAWDSAAKVPHFTYSASGVTHEVWYESSYSIEFKVDLVNRYGLGGAALWCLGQEDGRFWQVLTDGFSGGGSRTESFIDVPRGYWASRIIGELASLGVIEGVDGVHFQPDRRVCRAEFAALLTRALDLPAPEAAIPSFRDVTEGDWFYDAVTRAVAAGYMVGTGGGLFGPALDLTREEAAIVVNRIAASGEHAPSGASPAPSVGYTDSSSISEWALLAVLQATAKGLVAGYPDGSFRPLRGLTRAEAAVLIDRLE